MLTAKAAAAWLFGHDGLFWFIGASYRYIAPQGLRGHVRFVFALPGAAWRYMRMRATKWPVNR